MLTSLNFLDRLGVKLGDASDYRIAAELGVPRATVSRWRVGKGAMGEDNALKVAELLGEDPKFVLSCVLAERSHSEKAKKVLKQIADSFQAAAFTGIAVFAGITGLLSPSPANANARTGSVVHDNVYYDKLNTRLTAIQLKEVIPYPQSLVRGPQ